MTIAAALATSGHAFVDLASASGVSPETLRERMAASPHAFAASVLGVEPLLVERQPVRPFEGARAFAGSRAEAPLHTDSQLLLGVPPAVQILVCVRPATRGGESVLVDGADVLARCELDAPAVARALFEADRLQRFAFGDVTGPTVSLRGGHVAWTLAPRAEDAVAVALAPVLGRTPSLVRRLAAGEALVASNHRMLHGRTPFEGERELVRLLVWLEEPLASSWPDEATRARTRVVVPSLSPDARRRLRSVLAILRGAPPAKVARDAEVDEATLYGWREQLLGGRLA